MLYFVTHPPRQTESYRLRRAVPLPRVVGGLGQHRAAQGSVARVLAQIKVTLLKIFPSWRLLATRSAAHGPGLTHVPHDETRRRGFTKDELREHLKQFSGYSFKAISNIFKLLDVNNDGGIEKAEIREAFVKYSALRLAVGEGPNFK